MGDIKDMLKKSTSYDKGEPLASFKITSDSQTSQLEPIYYWILDFMQDMGIKVEKITDNFTASPGSGQFLELNQRMSKQRQEAMNTLGAINQVVKSILNLLYDLKEFETRLDSYTKTGSKDKIERDAGILAIKQIWLDNVDIKRGNTSIKAMTFSQAPFATLIDAFMIINSAKDVEKMDLNERVKRILKQRIEEFNTWRGLSEKELKKRFEVERAYLKSQVETLKLYTAWVRPYLKSAEELRMKGFEKSPALVNAFSTTMFELVLFGKSKFDFEKAVASRKLPPGFKNYKLKRNYSSCFLVSFSFRGHLSQRATQRGDQAFALGGRVNMTFDCYALNEQEINLLEKELRNQDIEDSFKFIQESTDKSLEELKNDIEHFLEEGKEKEKKQEKKEDDINPFSALFSIFKPKEKKQEEVPEIKSIKKDNYIEKEVRKIVGNTAKDMLYTIYDIYKKAHGMLSTNEPFDM